MRAYQRPRQRRFNPFKSVCKRCIETTRIPWAVYQPGCEWRPPMGWWEEDDKRWDKGLVICPQADVACHPMRRWCLKAKEVDAMDGGYAVVWNESEEIFLDNAGSLKGSVSGL